MSNDVEWEKLKLDKSSFNQMRQFIEARLGIKMPDAKKSMLEARLQKRVRHYSFPNFKEYVDYVFSDQGLAGELQTFIDIVTTNKTDFFREMNHFLIMREQILPYFLSRKHYHIKIWSAGCSTGEEPYSLAIELEEFCQKHPEMNYEILATDINNEVLKIGKMGIYDRTRIDDVPLGLKKKYFLKSKDSERHQVRVVPKLRKKIRFHSFNLLHDTMDTSFDIIFCRNVMIYFHRETQAKIVSTFIRQLRTGGYLLIGHSETLAGMDIKALQVAPTVYQKKGTL